MRKNAAYTWNKLMYLENKDFPYSEEEMHFLYTLAKSKNAEFRMWAAILLADHYTILGEDILYHLTFDKSYLVKLNAVDSLCIGQSLKSLQRLKTLTQNEDYLIRGYAILSYCDVAYNINADCGQAVIIYLQNILDQEKNNWVKAVVFEKLYIYGEYQYLTEMIELYKDCVSNENYEHIWCLLNAFSEIINEENSEGIVKVLHASSHFVLHAQKEKIDEIIHETRGKCKN